MLSAFPRQTAKTNPANPANPTTLAVVAKVVTPRTAAIPLSHRDIAALTPARWPLPALVLDAGDRLALRPSGHKSGHNNPATLERGR